MKKQYQRPEVRVLVIDTESTILAASTQYEVDSIPQLSDTPADNSTNLGKRHVIDWDEEEE